MCTHVIIAYLWGSCKYCKGTESFFTIFPVCKGKKNWNLDNICISKLYCFNIMLSFLYLLCLCPFFPSFLLHPHPLFFVFTSIFPSVPPSSHLSYHFPFMLIPSISLFNYFLSLSYFIFSCVLPYYSTFNILFISCLQYILPFFLCP